MSEYVQVVKERRSLRHGDADRPIEWCRQGAHCTDHPYVGQTCCRCGTTEFDQPNLTAGMTRYEAHGAGLR